LVEDKANQMTKKTKSTAKNTQSGATSTSKQVVVFQHGAATRARLEEGRAKRELVPLESHAAQPAQRRDAIDILMAQDDTRLPELVPIRHGRLSASPFTFFRAAAAIMASDLAATPTSDMRLQLCGDAHLSNFGMFNGPDRRLVFDLNDFDETLPGPFEWDVKRLAASIVLAGRENGFKSKEIAACARASVRGYREMMAKASQVAPMALHYYRLEVDELLAQTTDDKLRKRVEKVSAKAVSKNSVNALGRLTQIVDGRHRIVEHRPLIIRVDDLLEREGTAEVIEFFRAYLTTLQQHRRHLLERYSVVDMAHKIVGVGSVGTRCMILLLESGDGDPLFLQFKEATESVLAPYCGASRFEQHGERVVEGQRLMQSMGDIFLGWSQFHGPHKVTDFYFRQMWDGKGSFDTAVMRPVGLERYSAVCGQALALAHARSGDAGLISGYLGDDATFDDAIATFADGYADITEGDHGTHAAAIAQGRIEAVRDI
jgi:uncharacterized protein (DUF2252 family)